MNETDKCLLYNSALNEYGIKAQQMVLIEECGELLDVIAKSYRNRTGISDIITELADVSIMVEQMAFFYGLDDYRAEKERKLLRLKERLSNHLDKK